MVFHDSLHVFFSEVLQSRASNRLTQIEQRRDFYLWYYHQVSSKGVLINWPLAAYLVADAVAKLAKHDYFIGNNSLENFFRTGNQVIFDDVLPKLSDAFDREDLKNAQKALEWDRRILFEEQHLIQPLYLGLSKANFDVFSDISKNKDSLVFLGRLLYGPVYLKEVAINQGLSVPSFPEYWSLGNSAHRFYYGMVLADFFCNAKRQEAIAIFISNARAQFRTANSAVGPEQEKLIVQAAHRDYVNTLFINAYKNYPIPDKLDSRYVVGKNSCEALDAVHTKTLIHILTTVLTDFFIDDGEIVLIDTCLKQIRKDFDNGNRIAIEILENDPFYLRRLSSLSHRVNKDIINSVRAVLSRGAIQLYERFMSSLQNINTPHN